MEYRINKIDTDIRQKINEERSEDKVHNKKGITVNKDKNGENGNLLPNSEKESNLDKKLNKEAEEEKKEVVEEGKGHFIDIRR